MHLLRRVPSFGIWGLALGYFLFYIPYSALTKALSKGLLPGMEGPLSGFELLPATVLATAVTLPLFITLAGWWRHVPRRVEVLGIPLPVPRWQTLVSGVATAVIIATTTLNYTFTGISIVFALLMMRGGVLVMAPVVDRAFGRTVHWYSWVALALSLTAIGVAFAEQGGYQMTLVAGLNVGAYLAGYVFRLQFMTRLAKSARKEANIRFFVEETFVAAVTLLLVPAAFAFLGQGALAEALRAGFTTFLLSDLVAPALLAGFFYACLYFFGSRIYLDRRENTFCIPLNRCASLLSGVVASYLLMRLFGLTPPSGQQLTAAGILASAMLVLAYPAWRTHVAVRTLAPLQKAFLFICNDNTARSPMAQALCRAELAALLRLPAEALDAHVQVASAGLTATPGTPMADVGQAALARLGVPLLPHRAQPVTAALVAQADVVFCMTEAQRQTLSARFPEATAKIRRLDPGDDVGYEHEGGTEALVAMGRRMRQLIRRHVLQPQPTPATV